MKVRVVKSYVSYNKSVYAPGDTFEVDKETSKRLLGLEVVEEVKADEAVEVEETPSEAVEVEELEDVEEAVLPAADPVASVKKTTTKAKNTTKAKTTTKGKAKK